MRERVTHLMEGWSAPPELAGSPPREVRYSAIGILLMVVAAGMLVGGAFLSYGLYQANQSAGLLAAEGQDTDGVVERLWRGGRKNREYLISYRFTAQGSPRRDQAAVPRSFWESASEGQPIRIRYVPGNAAINRPADAGSTDQPLVALIVLPLTFVGVPAFLAYRLRAHRQLLEDGRAAPAVITKTMRTKHGRHIRFAFPLPGGGTQSGSGPARKSVGDVGSRITVVYDPDQPRRAQPYPLQLVRVVRG